MSGYLKAKVSSFFFEKIDGSSAHLFRVCYGTLNIFWVLFMLPVWERVYSPGGMLRYTPKVLFPGNAPFFSLMDHSISYLSVYFWWSILFFVSVFYLLGYKPRFFSGLLLIIHTAVIFRNLTYSNAEQTAMRMCFFYGMFIPLGRKDEKMVEAWRFRVFQFHLCAIYLISTPWKFFSDVKWRNGESMSLVLMDNLWSKFEYPGFLVGTGFFALLTWGSLLFEGSYSFLVWTRFRRYVVPLMIFFHTMISIFLNHVGFFSLSIGLAHIIFLKKEDLDYYTKFIRRFFPVGSFRRKLAKET